MIKKFVTIVVLTLITQLNISAACYMVLHKSDGSDVAFMLAEKPIITFYGLELNISCCDNVISIARKDIRNIDFNDEQDGLKDFEAFEDWIEVLNNNTIRFYITDNADINVYDISGRRISDATIIQDGDYVTVGFNTCNKGIYLIGYKNKTFKYIKK